MYNDTISDFLTRIRNAFMVNRSDTRVKYSRVIEAVLNVLKKEGYILSFEKDGYYINVKLNTEMPISHIKRISKPGFRRYVKSGEIPHPKSGFGFVVISTPKGVLTGNQARKQKVGGELICEVW